MNKCGYKTIFLLLFLVFLISLLFLRDSDAAAAGAGDEKMRVAVVEFDVKGDLGIKDAGAIVAEWMISSIGKTGKFDLKERVLLKKVLEEQKLVLSGIMDNKETVTKIGKLYGIKGIIAGGVLRWGNTISVTARLIDTTTGSIIRTCDLKTSNVDEIPNKIDDLALILAGELSPLEAHLSEQTNVPAEGSPMSKGASMVKGDKPRYWQDPVTGMEFVWIEGGCYKMGQSETEAADIIAKEGKTKYRRFYDDEMPEHKVCVDGLWVGAYEVTNKQFRIFQPDHSSKDYKGMTLNSDKQPAVYVSWTQAKSFAQWLTDKNQGNKKFRLPTEAEWEYICKAGTKSSRFWGDDSDDACRYGNVFDRTAQKKDTLPLRNHDCDDGYVVTAPVGSFEPNPYGIYDLLGNVWEWVEDDYLKDGYKTYSKNNPVYKSDGSSNKVRRGGSWADEPPSVRCSNRGNRSAEQQNNKIGFRLVFGE